ncbi:MAG TPA: chromate resistance protein ChrB domain-containing protein [Candidatus Binataceae bacterium]|nr:chromate resistance protein ChrB domain-containing protein [Candidatus Binataceae bacterium]
MEEFAPASSRKPSSTPIRFQSFLGGPTHDNADETQIPKSPRRGIVATVSSKCKWCSMTEERTRWLLLIHQIPPKPDYLRVKVWRRMQRVGAVAVKNSVYVLPKHEETLEDFQWILREIKEGGGEGSICEAGFVDGLSDPDVEGLFRSARDADYSAITEGARALQRSLPAPGRKLELELRAQLEADVRRLRKRLEEVVAIDFFDSLGRQSAEGLVGSLESQLDPESSTERNADQRTSEYRGRVWVTRRGIHVDRMASAWLLRRFVDPEAKFKFVPARGYRPEKGEIRFDMFEADFTHEGDRCTLEVLLQRFKLDTTALRPIAEIVHDIDLKDSKFGRPETAGIERLITGICGVHKDDEARLARASALFDDLYGSFTRRSH